LKVFFQKADMDTCLTALIMGVDAADDIIFIRGNAPKSALEDPSILCIECGGGGGMALKNLDHHVPDAKYPPACLQALRFKPIHHAPIVRLAEYVGLVDEGRHIDDPIPFPSLSAIFSGMLLTEHEPLRQFNKGIELFKEFLNQGFDPFQTLPDLPRWRAYRVAKAKNLRKNKGILAKSIFFKTDSGKTLGFVETDAFGGRGRLYAAGCDIVIMFHPAFGTPPLSKYTIASNVTDVIRLKPHFDQVERGWGGRSAIIGSPRRGTSLTRRQVLEIVLRHL
jgi:hypothetical protein